MAHPPRVQAAGGDPLVEVTVTNAGSLPSGPTRVRLTDRPPLVARPEGGAVYPRHAILPHERALVIWPEARPDGFRLRVRWQGSDAGDSFAGRVRLENAAGVPIPLTIPVQVSPAGAGRVVPEGNGWVGWEAASGRQPAGFDLILAAGVTPARFTLADLSLDGVANLRQIFIGNWWITRFFGSLDEDDQGLDGEAGVEAASDAPATGPGPLTIALDDPRLAHAALPPSGPESLWAEQALPGLDPGGRATLTFRLTRLPVRIFVEVDPEDQVREVREGNNVAHAGTPSPHGAMVSLHTHASLSEGTASVDSQMDLLARSGYNAVFWTEHDWRVQGAGFKPVSGFEEEPGPGTWFMVAKRLDPGLAATASPSAERASEGDRALRLEATRSGRGSGQAQAAWGFRIYRGRQIRALAQELVLSFDVFPDAARPLDSELTLELELSDQPRVKRRLLYRVEASPVAVALPQAVMPPPPAPEETGRVTVRPGRWTRVVIPVSEHARALFPEGSDNALTGTQLGVAVWEGNARWDVDRLALEAAVEGDPLLALQEEWARRYPALTSHVTSEISYYIPHLNPFVAERFLLDYEQVGWRDYLARAVEETRRRHGALSLNHPLGFGLPYPPRHVQEQISHRLFGADLVEVGYRFRGGAGLAEHLRFWDQALAAGVPASGIGVTDAHGAGRGNGFARDENNFATWVDADPASTEALIDGLLSGRLVFGDPLLFDGSLELAVDDLHVPGSVLVGVGRPRRARFGGRDLPPGSRLDLMVDGEVAATATAGDNGRAGGGLELDATTGFTRLAAWDPRGEPLAFTNAVLFLEAVPPEGLPAWRLRAEQGGMRLRGEGRYRVRELTLDESGLAISGEGQPGTLILEGGGGPPAYVLQADGVTPLQWTYDDASDTLRLPLAAGGFTLRWRGSGPPIPGGSWTLIVLLLVLASVLTWAASRRRRRRRT